jgi:signal transduction histidine kinase
MSAPPGPQAERNMVGAPSSGHAAAGAGDPDLYYALNERILNEQADSLLSTNQSFSVSGFLLAIGFGAIFFWKLRVPGILIWLLVMNLSQAVRVVYIARYIKTPLAQRNPQRAARWLCYAIGVTSSGWGLAPWLFFPEGDVTLMSIMMIVLLGLTSGGIASVAPYRRAVFCLVVPVLLGLAAAMLRQGDAAHLFLALCSLAYMAVCLKFGLQQNRLLGVALRARYEKEELAQRLAEQVRIVERASLEKTRFFASASHDLRQPLHSLGLFGSALLVTLKNTPDEMLARNLMHCVDALETSFSAMLDVSKLDAGVVEVNVSPVALGDVFRRLQSVFGRQAEAKGLSLRFSPGSKWVHADSALLERLVGNLVHNALQFTQRGGVVVVARTQGQNISLEVWDSGPGMDPLELPRIFDEFYQLGNRERDRSKGLGMGLAIVRRLSLLMGMPLQVQSRPGRGTVFKLHMTQVVPPAPIPFVPVRDTSANMPALVGRRVLIADDEENVRASTAGALRLYGLHVEVADGIPQARELARRFENEGRGFDAVITDFRLRNNEDGIALVAGLRAMLGRELPALLVTGDTAPERVRQAQHSGLRALYKPIKVHDLVEELRLQINPGP